MDIPSLAKPHSLVDFPSFLNLGNDISELSAAGAGNSLDLLEIDRQQTSRSFGELATSHLYIIGVFLTYGNVADSTEKSGC